mmetsp:Transcript_87/g.439  ORF Transcript_87/g.439 Transcript_87/m.439 type:complete len:236 (+) Transcript_87:1566-2273(+)
MFSRRRALRLPGGREVPHQLHDVVRIVQVKVRLARLLPHRHAVHAQVLVTLALLLPGHRARHLLNHRTLRVEHQLVNRHEHLLIRPVITDGHDEINLARGRALALRPEVNLPIFAEEHLHRGRLGDPVSLDLHVVVTGEDVHLLVDEHRLQVVHELLGLPLAKVGIRVAVVPDHARALVPNERSVGGVVVLIQNRLDDFAPPLDRLLGARWDEHLPVLGFGPAPVGGLVPEAVLG